MIDLQRSRSNSSVSDSQDFIAHSDTEMVTPMTTKRSSHHERQPRPPQHSSHHTPRLPHISKGHSALGYGLPSESLPVGYMPCDPWFVAVTDYDPQSIFSRSQRPEEELVLKEWDKVKVIGQHHWIAMMIYTHVALSYTSLPDIQRRETKATIVIINKIIKCPNFSISLGICFTSNTLN